MSSDKGSSSPLVLGAALLAAVCIFCWVTSGADLAVRGLLLIVYILFLTLLSKAIATWNALRWLKHKGSHYAKASGGRPITSVPDDFLLNFAPDFFPFGLKDFRLHRYIRDHHGLRRWLARWFQFFLFRFLRLSGILCFAAVCLASVFSWNATLRNALGDRGRALLILAATLPLVTNALLSVEFIYSNAILGGYAGPFHGREGEGEPKLLVELKGFAEKVATGLYAGAALTYVGYVYNFAFAGQILRVVEGARLCDTLTNRVAILLQCGYFSATTFTTVGFGDITPANPLGQLIASLIMVQSFFLVVMVLGSLMSVVSSPAKAASGGQSEEMASTHEFESSSNPSFGGDET